MLSVVHHHVSLPKQNSNMSHVRPEIVKDQYHQQEFGWQQLKVLFCTAHTKGGCATTRSSEITQFL
jgi:hypothetical protein